MVKGNPRGSHSARRARYALLAICCGGLYWMYSMTHHSAVLAASTDELLETAHGNIGGGGGLDGRAPPHKQLRAAAGRQGGSRQRNILWPDPSDMPPEAASVGAAEIALQKQTHIVFSTGCEKYHDWQSVGMFYSARRVTPFAPVTRLLSCLTAENEEENRILHGGSYKVNHKNQVIYTDPKKRAAGQYHLTPLYSPHPKTGDVYLPYFKSASMTHWFASAAAPKEPIVICVDPDFVMMRDIDMKGVTPETLKGKPIAMNYKTEQSCWGVLQHLLVEKGFACAECKERLGAVSFEQAKKALATGPPYVAHRDDWVTLAPRWKFYTEVIRDHARDYAGWIADMCSHGLAVIDLGLDQQLRGDWMTTGPIVLDESGQTSNAIAGPGTADAPNTDYFWRKGNWDPAAETFAVPPYTLHYDQKLYNVGMMWQWAKKTRAYRHDDVLECGRRFQPPPARHGLEESGAHWYIGHVMAELNAALDWYGERVYGKARNAACVLEQKEWARESYQPRVLSVMPKGAKNAYTIFTDKGKELQHAFLYQDGCFPKVMAQKSLDMYGGKFYKSCADENDEFSDKHCDGLPLTRAARKCDEDPRCGGFSYEDAGDYQGQPDPNLDYELAGLSVHFFSAVRLAAEVKKAPNRQAFVRGPSTFEGQQAVSREVENDQPRCFTYFKPEKAVLVADLIARRLISETNPINM